MKLKLMLLFLIITIFDLGISRSVSALTDTELAAESAILMDVATGKILYEKNCHAKCAPASTTKILTALVALEKGDLGQKIVVSDAASRQEGSSIYLSRGETYTLKELLYGLLLSSGNDAALAIAEGVAGTEAKFAELMNQKAQAIGAKSSDFKNCSGLPENGHFTTAYDLALITRYALHNPTFSQIVGTKRELLRWPGHDEDRTLFNHNKLLWRYQFADGVKTGYTRQAGRCLVSSATQNGQRLVSVVFNSKLMYEDSQKLFEYGFDNYQLVNLVSVQESMGTVNVEAGIKETVPVYPNRSVTMLFRKDMVDKLHINLELCKTLEAPVEKMQSVGEIQVKLGDDVMETVPVVASETVPRKTFFQKIWDWVKGVLTPVTLMHNMVGRTSYELSHSFRSNS